MNKLLSEVIGMADVLLCTATATSDFVPMNNCRKVLFVAAVGAMSAGSTLTLAGLESNDGGATSQPIAGVSAAGLPTALSALIEANTNVSEATITPAAGTSAGSTLTINGVTFTATAATAVATDEFKTATAAATLCTNIANAINGAGGVPGVKAAASATAITLTVDDPLETTITVATNNPTDLVLATTRACGYLEVDASMLSEGYDHVGVSATIVGGGPTRIIAIPGDLRYAPMDQAVAGSANKLA